MFGYHLEAIASVSLREAISHEMQGIMKSLFKTQKVLEAGPLFDRDQHFWTFFHLRRKRLNATMVLLVDLLGTDTISDLRLNHALELG